MGESEVHALELEPGQRVSVNDEKKQELEEAYPDRYAFEKVEHDGTESPIQGDAEFAWTVTLAGDPQFDADAQPEALEETEAEEEAPEPEDED